MTRRERLHHAYFHEPMDRPGVYVRTGFPGNDPTYDRLKACLAAHSELKRGWDAWQLAEPVLSEHSSEPARDGFDRWVTIIHTPRGDLRKTDLVSTRGQPGMEEESLLKSREDAERYLSLPPPRIDGAPEALFAVDREVGDAGITETSLGSNPGGFAAELFGSETFAILSMTDRDILHAVCERRLKIMLQLLDYVLARGAGPYFAMAGQEYIVPPLHGPADFDDFNVRYDKPLIDRVHEAGGRMHVHCHASVRKVFPGFLRAGVDVLHPFEAPPMGDITAADAKRMADGRLCLEGNIQVADMYEKPPEHVAAQTAALIETCFGDRRNLIVCPSASPYIRGAGEACFPMFKAMVDTVLHWKG